MAKEKGANVSDSTMKALLDNSITLQKTLADLAFNLKDLNRKVTDMLELFEGASRSMKESPPDSELAEKVGSLERQNRTIAKGLLLLEKSLRSKEDRAGRPKPLPTI